MGRCSRCGQQGIGSGYCPHCKSWQETYNMQLSMVEDARRLNEDLSAEFNACWCALCSWLCTSLCNCINQERGSDNGRLTEATPVLRDSQAHQRSAAERENIAAVLRRYEVYNLRDEAAMRHYVATSFRDDYHSTFNDQPYNTKAEIPQSYMEAYVNKRRISNIVIHSASATTITFSGTVHYPGGHPDGHIDATAIFNPPGKWASATFKFHNWLMASFNWTKLLSCTCNLFEAIFLQIFALDLILFCVYMICFNHNPPPWWPCEI